jgi:hypothetical protein
MIASERRRFMGELSCGYVIFYGGGGNSGGSLFDCIHPPSAILTQFDRPRKPLFDRPAKLVKTARRLHLINQLRVAVSGFQRRRTVYGHLSSYLLRAVERRAPAELWCA